VLWPDLLGHRSRVHAGSRLPVLCLQHKTGSASTLRVGLGTTPASCALKVRARTCSGVKASGKGLGCQRCGSCPCHLPWPLSPVCPLRKAGAGGFPRQRGFGWLMGFCSWLFFSKPFRQIKQNFNYQGAKMTVAPRLKAPQSQPGHRNHPNLLQLSSDC